MFADESFVGKGYKKKIISYHAKMRHGIMMRLEYRLTLVRELTPKEEAEVAKI